ncbi:hypothetical protein CJ030_MR1G014147, partial [Morella rubra]
KKLGFLDFEKLPGRPKKTEEIPPPPPQTEYATAELSSQEGEVKEKKGFLEKIKEKLPRYHPEGKTGSKNLSGSRGRYVGLLPSVLTDKWASRW